MNAQNIADRLNELNRRRNQEEYVQPEIDALNAEIGPYLAAVLIESPYPDLSGVVVEYALIVNYEAKGK